MMADDLPFQAEYAKSNRASCKACKEKIDKDSLRIARMVQVRHAEAYFVQMRSAIFDLLLDIRNWTYA